MSPALTMILLVAAAYLAAHVAFDWLGRRFLIVSGAEYLLLGILLGPEVANVIRADVVGGFAPFMTLALGWVGAVVGAQFHLPTLLGLSGRLFRVAFLEATLSLVVVTAVMTGVLAVVIPVSPLEALVPAVALGAVAVASAPAGIALVARRLGRQNSLIRQLEVATGVDALVAIVAFGVLLSVTHPVVAVASRPPTATEWAVISLGIGLVGGALFHLFLGDEREIDRLFVALAGALILVSGAAAYLRLSPLLPAMLVGSILVNTAPNREEIERVLRSVERPLYFVLLVFAGAAWRPGGGWEVVVPVFLAARLAAKPAAAWAAAAATGSLPALGAGWGRALLGHGGLALALGLNYRIYDDVPYPHLVFTAIVASVLLTDLASARLVREVLRPRLPQRAARRMDRSETP